MRELFHPIKLTVTVISRNLCSAQAHSKPCRIYIQPAYHLIIILLGILATTSSYADATLATKIKAGYLYNFTKFISWPALTTDTFNLCIIGNDPFGALIDPIEKKFAHGKPIKVLRLRGYTGEQHCHIAFLSSVEQSAPGANSFSTKTTGSIHPATLTVSNASSEQTGAIIEFVRVDDKIRLRIDLARLRTSSLKINAKLLEVAEIIGEDKR